MSTRQNDTGILKIPSARYEVKKWINEGTKPRLLNKASLVSKQFNVIKCLKIDLNYIILQTFQKIDGIYQL